MLAVSSPKEYSYSKITSLPRLDLFSYLCHKEILKQKTELKDYDINLQGSHRNMNMLV